VLATLAHAVARLGAWPVILNARLSEREVETIVAHCRAAADRLRDRRVAGRGAARGALRDARHRQGGAAALPANAAARGRAGARPDDPAGSVPP
jgi:acyl-CoA synthetase (AMP-forming)/AMP-acid ligase II